ncbi:hypothetical protein EPUS_07468 [Endocarpon pusillum Z07020]|uniref:Uncharacterized protein n=1 Tax=Endocarpon pusillum (strain Z07020 / HMAS-L-300199) TaxID=1263415 RepID=U1HQI6_ENDPU|nr:uncharacterized protein EPUS_07468 [Endocarpon pusillum Z07020]ERF72675.1 hypothetical protein EPUS_07468 [Endocarpon pusillum Z07020]
MDSKLEEEASIPTLYNAVERFRNNLRLTRATSTKSSLHTLFTATLQEEEASELAADSAASAEKAPSETKKYSNCLCGKKHAFSMCPYLIEQRRPSSASLKAGVLLIAYATLQGEEASELAADSAASAEKAPSETKKYSNCLCGEKHTFSMCPYLIEQRRPKGWSPIDRIQKEINEKLKNPALKRAVKRAQSAANKLQERSKKQKQQSELPEDSNEQHSAPSTPLASFATDWDSYELRDTWILDSGAN